MEYGLIGEKLGHSISPQLHRMFADYDYQLIELAPDKVAEFIQARQFRGLNVTIPYKRTVIPFCDELTPRAKSIGSVNTLFFDSAGRMIGDNTDYDGFLMLAAAAGISFTGKKVLLMGSGGTSLTAYAAASDQGAAEIVRVSRSGPVDYDHLSEHRNSQIILNTTPVGMYPNVTGQLITLSDFPECEGLLDVIYNPLRTRLVLDARSHGIPSSGGLRMLVGQARRAAEDFTGKSIPNEKVEEVFRTIERSRENIILCGMPGCGKSTIGKALSKELSRPFIDTDDLIKEKTSRTPEEIIRQDGEAAFRAVESQITAEAAREAGHVIALGGGTILAEQNVTALRQNGRIFFLNRPLEKLELANGRPLSQTQAQLTSLYQHRLPIYKSVCDKEIENSGPLSETISAILTEWNCTKGES